MILFITPVFPVLCISYIFYIYIYSEIVACKFDRMIWGHIMSHIYENPVEREGV